MLSSISRAGSSSTSASSRGAELDHLGQARDQVAALDLLDADLGLRHDAAYVYLDLLGRLGADEDVVAPPYVADYRVVQSAARDLYGLALSHAAEGDDRRLRSAAADVYYEVAVRLGDVDARAVGRGDRALDEVHLARAGLDHRVYDRALLHARDAARHADEHPRLEEAEARDAADELLEHGDGHVVVGDDAVGDGLDGHYARGGAAQHLLRVVAHLQQAARELVHGHDGRLAYLHALAP